MNATECDVLIAGGGCAGLSFAVHLIDAGVTDASVLIVEPRRAYRRDKTWCYWRTEPHPFESCVSHRWHAWQVRHGGRHVVQTSTEYPYEHIPSDVFYSHALKRIEASTNIRLLRETRIERLERSARGIVAETNRGPVCARIAFDSRPRMVPPRAGDLFQSFSGWFVEADRPTFDPQTATLMDFDIAQRPAIRFFYVLPFDSRRALVEDTHIGPSPASEQEGHFALADYIGKRWPSVRYRVEHRERGCIPMSLSRGGRWFPSIRGSAPIIPMGLAGGAAKPSSGYAFPFIQRFCAAAARAVKEAPLGRLSESAFYGRSWRSVHGRVAQTLDAMFLSQLAAHPAQAPALFYRLAERVPASAFVRFLAEQASPSDLLAVMRALPAMPLLRQAVRPSVLASLARI